MSKLRSDSILASLTEDQRDQLYDWLCSASYAEVIALAAKPVADGGFNLKLHRTTLARFLEHEQRERRARDVAFGKPPPGQFSTAQPENLRPAKPQPSPAPQSVDNNPASSAVPQTDSVLST